MQNSNNSISSELQVKSPNLNPQLHTHTHTFQSLQVAFFFSSFFFAVSTARDAISMQKICYQGNRGEGEGACMCACVRERERESEKKAEMQPLNTRTAAAAAADVEHSIPPLPASVQQLYNPAYSTHMKAGFECFQMSRQLGFHFPLHLPKSHKVTESHWLYFTLQFSSALHLSSLLFLSKSVSIYRQPFYLFSAPSLPPSPPHHLSLCLFTPVSSPSSRCVLQAQIYFTDTIINCTTLLPKQAVQGL